MEVFNSRSLVLKTYRKSEWTFQWNFGWKAFPLVIKMTKNL